MKIKTLADMKKDLDQFWKDYRGSQFSFPMGRIPKGFSRPPRILIARTHEASVFPRSLTIDGRQYDLVQSDEIYSSKSPSVTEAICTLYNGRKDYYGGTPIFEPRFYYRLFLLKAPEIKYGNVKKNLPPVWRIVLYRRGDPSRQKWLHKPSSARIGKW